jgi:23S rRNA pseudouridine2605 synthase
MFLAIGHPVLKLKRVEYGPVRLGDLPFGQYRYLTPGEMGKLEGLELKAQRGQQHPID